MTIETISDYQNEIKQAIRCTINDMHHVIGIDSIKIKPESRIQGLLGSRIQGCIGLDYNVEYESRVKEIRKSMFYYHLENEFKTNRLNYLSDCYKYMFDRKGGNVDLVITDINSKYSACSLLSGDPYALIELKTDVNAKGELEKDLKRIYDFISLVPERNKICYTSLIIIHDHDFNVNDLFSEFNYKEFDFSNCSYGAGINCNILNDNIKLPEIDDYQFEDNGVIYSETRGRIFYYSIITLYRENKPKFGDKLAAENQNPPE
ncbi:TPA: hypothetical protein U2I61_002018 [Providencia rettgeri]|nr:hypothetical protein [Providencia rettgeri]